ncbi:MAG: HAD-IIIA family hydrolase [Candidatus Omnitrophica bacterium]|nr:HAD-IIIA family hydrolase [Candidatus Omnitrophota bacterium]
MLKNISKRIKKIKVFVMDVDGVMTNGSINMDEHGHEIKMFNVQDGLGIAVLRKAGIHTAIITARASGCVSARALDLKIDKVYQDAYPKSAAFADLLKNFNVSKDEVCFIGDDLPDISVLKQAGFAVAVRNASTDAKKYAHYVTKNSGGNGAIREVVELILKTQGKWHHILETFK